MIVFPQGEIAPYYMGTPEFVIPNQVIENELAAPNYLNNFRKHATFLKTVAFLLTQPSQLRFY